MDFFTRVKDMCRNKQLGMREFIESLGLNYDSYNSLKRYNNLPRADEAYKIAQGLDTSVDYLVSGQYSDSKLSDEDQKLINLILSLQAPCKDNIKSIAEQLSQLPPIIKSWKSDLTREEIDEVEEDYRKMQEKEQGIKFIPNAPD